MAERTRLAEARWRAGVTQTEIAKQCGVTPKTVSRWEAGETAIPLAMGAVFAATCGVTLDWLAGIANDDEVAA